MAIYQEIKKKISRPNSPTLNDKIKKNIKNIDKKKSIATCVDLIKSRPGITPEEGKGKKQKAQDPKT